MLLNKKLNDKDQKILWEKEVNTCESVRNGMATTRSTNIPSKHFYGENPKIIGFVLRVWTYYICHK